MVTLIITVLLIGVADAQVTVNINQNSVPVSTPEGWVGTMPVELDFTGSSANVSDYYLWVNDSDLPNSGYGYFGRLQPNAKGIVVINVPVGGDAYASDLNIPSGGDQDPYKYYNFNVGAYAHYADDSRTITVSLIYHSNGADDACIVGDSNIVDVAVNGNDEMTDYDLYTQDYGSLYGTGKGSTKGSTGHTSTGSIDDASTILQNIWNYVSGA